MCDSARRIASAFDEPFADVSAFSTLRVSELAREQVTVALSGDGGDELFAGYDVYRAHRWAERLRWMRGSFPWTIVERMVDRAPPSSAKKNPVNLAKRFVEGLNRPEDLEHARWWVFWDLSERRRLYSPEMMELVRQRDCFEHYRARLGEGKAQGFTGLNRQLYADITGYLADDILVKVDRMSMAVSLEARVPLLDHRVVAFSWSLPPEMKTGGGVGKRLLRAVLHRYVPRELVDRPKKGFAVPLDRWLRSELRDWAENLLDARRLEREGILDSAAIRRRWTEHLAGKRNWQASLWTVLMFQAWKERWLA
jgi:asparagine synthase (glutamine-hydrolysing)